MKSIVSWNVNGMRSIFKKGFLDWLSEENPDILCLQETKLQENQVPEELISPYKYKTYWHCAEKKGYSGTVVFSKMKVSTVSHLKLKKFDNEGRLQQLDFPKFTLINTYFPNSQEKGKRLEYKLDFCDAVLKLCNKITRAGKPLVICGDFNIAHKEIDLANPKQNEQNPGFLPEERAWLDDFVTKGYVDSFRIFNKEAGQYTWWSYRTRARERNVGWRIDHHFVNSAMAKKVKDCVILKDVMGSDHCPIKLYVSF
ncbi:MAG: exodeoxyribonuclease III [Zetaproteobacteria bacterium]|nr:exodeoxyribonuclease III [Pseudobdellovibrionaceae bacterium]|tara:strand:+ start:1214 stop:1978 length:765 start_codon:yes stop_codon:yes gene_type:complete